LFYYVKLSNNAVLSFIYATMAFITKLIIIKAICTKTVPNCRWQSFIFFKYLA
jgi:hypothetical protein